MTESLRDRMMGKAVSKNFRREDATKAGNCRKERREHKDFILCGLSVLCVSPFFNYFPFPKPP